MTKEQTSLCEKIKSLGYVQGSQVRLYGEVFDLISDPIAVNDKIVFLEAREHRSGSTRHVRIPMNIVHQVAKQDRIAA